MWPRRQTANPRQEQPAQLRRVPVPLAARNRKGKEGDLAAPEMSTTTTDPAIEEWAQFLRALRKDEGTPARETTAKHYGLASITDKSKTCV